MKLKKRILTLLIISGISISVVGCNSKTENNNEQISAQNEVALNDSLNEDEAVDKVGVTEEEALEIVTEYVHKVSPEAKLRVHSKEYVNSTECYVIKYEGKFATDDSFIVDVNTGEAKAVIYSSDNYVDINEWVTVAKKDLSRDIYSAEVAKKRALSALSYENYDYYRAEMSENQKANIELAEDYMVQVSNGSFYWVFKYPMEKSHTMTDKGYTETNSYDENDEFGYFYVNPYMNWIMFRPNEWNPEQLPEVN